MEYFLTFIAFFSLVTSAVALSYTVVNSKIKNEIDINQYYCGKIFDNFILYSIPKAVLAFRLHDNKLLYIGSKLENQIIKLNNSILYYKYRDVLFHNKIHNLAIEIDDYLVPFEEKILSENEFLNIKKEIDNKISRLYILIGEYYQGNTIMEKYFPNNKKIMKT